MKTITFSADIELIGRARLIARSQPKTLNAAFREWLRTFTAAQSGSHREFDRLMRRLRHIDAGGPYSQDEMNERQVLSSCGKANFRWRSRATISGTCRAWTASSTPYSRGLIWNGKPAPSGFLHKQLDVTQCRKSLTTRVTAVTIQLQLDAPLTAHRHSSVAQWQSIRLLTGGL